MAAKLSPYQKLKQENQQLKADLAELVQNPLSHRSWEIRKQFKFYTDMEKSLWQGDFDDQDFNLKGIIGNHKKIQ